MVEEQQESTARELARGTVELAVLGLLRSRPRYGYELLSSYNDVIQGAIELKEGTLYPILHRLEDAGFVVTSWEAEGRGPPRKYYSLTGSGAVRFKSLRSSWDHLVRGMAEMLDGRRRSQVNEAQHAGAKGGAEKAGASFRK